MKQRVKQLSAVAILVLAVVFAGATSEAGELKPGTKAPAWILKSLAGDDVKSTKYNGKVVVLNFWATWCGPCIAEIPDFIELQKEYEKKGLTFVGVSLDQSSTPVKKYVKKTKVNYPVVMGTADVVKDYGNFSGIPQTYVIDKEGIIRLSQTGMIAKEALLAKVKPLL